MQWLQELRESGRAERRAYRGFLRRSWQHQRVLSTVWIACALGTVAVGVLRLDDDSTWSTLLWLALLVGHFVCWVLLIRRDDPDGTL